MKRVVIAVIALLMVQMLGAQDELGLFPYWYQGDTGQLIISEGYEKYEGDELVEKEVVKSKVEITVLEETDTSYLVEWRYVDYGVERVNVASDEEDLEQRLSEMFDDVSVLYEIDESGGYLGLTNYEELKQMTKDSMDAYVKHDMKDEDVDQEIFLEIVDELLESDFLLEELERDIFTYHYYHAGSFTVDTLVRYDDELEHRAFGKIPAQCEVTTVINEETETFHITDVKEIDIPSIHKFMTKMMNELKDKKRRKIVEEQMLSIDWEITEYENYSYYYQTGWLAKYEHLRVIKTDDDRIETFLRMDELLE